MSTCHHFTNISISQCLECIQTNRWISRGNLREVFRWYLGKCACVCVAACPPTLFTSVPMKILFTRRTLFNDCFSLYRAVHYLNFTSESGCFSWSPKILWTHSSFCSFFVTVRSPEGHFDLINLSTLSVKTQQVQKFPMIFEQLNSRYFFCAFSLTKVQALYMLRPEGLVLTLDSSSSCSSNSCMFRLWQ